MTRFWLFLSSLAPVFLVVGIRLCGSNLWWGVGLFAAGLLLFPVSYTVLLTRRSVVPKPIRIRDTRDETYQVPTYLLTFIFPFLFIDVSDIWNMLAYLLLVLFVALLLFRSDLSIVNPALLLVGYNMYSVQAEGGEDLIFISKVRPRVGMSFAATPLSGYVYLNNKKETERINV